MVQTRLIEASLRVKYWSYVYSRLGMDTFMSGLHLVATSDVPALLALNVPTDNILVTAEQEPESALVLDEHGIRAFIAPPLEIAKDYRKRLLTMTFWLDMALSRDALEIVNKCLSHGLKEGGILGIFFRTAQTEEEYAGEQALAEKLRRSLATLGEGRTSGGILDLALAINHGLLLLAADAPAARATAVIRATFSCTSGAGTYGTMSEIIRARGGKLRQRYEEEESKGFVDILVKATEEEICADLRAAHILTGEEDRDRRVIRTLAGLHGLDMDVMANLLKGEER